MDNTISIDRLENGWILHLNDGEVIRHIAFTVDDDIDGLKDGYLEMLSEITDFLGESGSKHDKLRVSLGYKIGTASDEEIKELQEKTNWPILFEI